MGRPDDWIALVLLFVVGVVGVYLCSLRVADSGGFTKDWLCVASVMCASGGDFGGALLCHVCLLEFKLLLKVLFHWPHLYPLFSVILFLRSCSTLPLARSSSISWSYF